MANRSTLPLPEIDPFSLPVSYKNFGKGRVCWANLVSVINFQSSQNILKTVPRVFPNFDINLCDILQCPAEQSVLTSDQTNVDPRTARVASDWF